MSSGVKVLVMYRSNFDTMTNNGSNMVVNLSGMTFGNQYVEMIASGESFTLDKGVIQVPVPDDTVSLETGNYVMSLGGSKKTLQVQGTILGGSRSEVVSTYNAVKSFFNKLKIGDKIAIAFYDVETKAILYAYFGVVASVNFRWSAGEPVRIAVVMTFYVGKAL